MIEEICNTTTGTKSATAPFGNTQSNLPNGTTITVPSNYTRIMYRDNPTPNTTSRSQNFTTYAIEYIWECMEDGEILSSAGFNDIRSAGRLETNETVNHRPRHWTDGRSKRVVIMEGVSPLTAPGIVASFVLMLIVVL